MSKRKINIYLVTVALLLPVILLCIGQMEGGTLPFCVNMESEGNLETINLWEGKDGINYVFLPSCAETAQTSFHLNTSNPVYLDGQLLSEGMPCDGFATEKTYTIHYRSWGTEKEKQVVFLRSANVPAIFLDTQSGSMDYIHEKKGNKESGMLRVYTETGVLDYTGSLESIKGRGNATWTSREKKPYSLTLTENADLLGMGNAQKWILLANAVDSSNLRNKIVYDFAKEIGLAYSPDSQWVDVYLNNEYAGLYLLCERNEIHPERIAISENDGFVVSLELEERLVTQNYTYITTDARQALRIHNPLDVSEEFLEELEIQWQAVENALLADDGIDPITGKSWEEQIDLDSWTRKYLIEEIFGSIDACMVSQYFYKDGTGEKNVIFAGPVWDFDNSMGNASCWELTAAKSFLATHPHDREGLLAPWFYCLYQKDLFYNKVVELYESDFLPALDNLMRYGITNYIEQIQDAAIMNEVRWFENSTGFFEEVAYISSYMSTRIDFFTKIWCEDMEYYLVKADYSHDCWYAVFSGECPTELYELKDNEYAIFTGWYYSDTNEPFDRSKPITEDVEIYPNWEIRPPNRINQLAKITPLGIIGGIGMWILLLEIKRIAKSR